MELVLPIKLVKNKNSIMSKFRGTNTAHGTRCGECANVSPRNNLEPGIARTCGIWESTLLQLSPGSPSLSFMLPPFCHCALHLHLSGVSRTQSVLPPTYSWPSDSQSSLAQTALAPVSANRCGHGGGVTRHKRSCLTLLLFNWGCGWRQFQRRGVLVGRP